MLRSLLGQSDTNDAALVFGKQHQQQEFLLTRTDSKEDSAEDEDFLFCQTTTKKKESIATVVSSSSSSSLPQEQAQSINGPAQTAAERTKDVNARRSVVQEEEKKEDFADEENCNAVGNSDSDSDDQQQNACLPTAFQPVSQRPVENNDDDKTAVSEYSALSEAPSVEESIRSDMGWF